MTVLFRCRIEKPLLDKAKPPMSHQLGRRLRPTSHPHATPKPGESHGHAREMGGRKCPKRCLSAGFPDGCALFRPGIPLGRRRERFPRGVRPLWPGASEGSRVSRLNKKGDPPSGRPPETHNQEPLKPYRFDRVGRDSFKRGGSSFAWGAAPAEPLRLTESN
jgi:hypothetical protein